MKIKNKELEAGIRNISSLGPISMDGDITLSAIKRRKELTNLMESYSDAKTAILEAIGKKDETGAVIKKYEDTTHGQIVSYEFETPEIQAQCLKNMKDLDNIENVVIDGTIESARVLSFRTTPEQLEGLLLITKPE